MAATTNGGHRVEKLWRLTLIAGGLAWLCLLSVVLLPLLLSYGPEYFGLVLTFVLAPATILLIFLGATAGLVALAAGVAWYISGGKPTAARIAIALLMALPSGLLVLIALLEITA